MLFKLVIPLKNLIKLILWGSYMVCNGFSEKGVNISEQSQERLPGNRFDYCYIFLYLWNPKLHFREQSAK